jgi:2-C-methyl-D-erythritol 4-phosphate cytidylyltransferase
VEVLGGKPRLVMGDSRNIKVTFARDVALAELVLRDLEREEGAVEH